ncbi:MAG: SUMF1/EgtB/PvdO family nonheme iron enzyme [Chthoniobacterales bacterium]
MHLFELTCRTNNPPNRTMLIEESKTSSTLAASLEFDPGNVAWVAVKDGRSVRRKLRNTSVFWVARRLVSVAILSTVITSTTTKADTFGSGFNQFTLDFVTVGDAGNPSDTGTTGSYSSPYGAVAYDFRIGTTEISRGAIQSANAAGNLGITLTTVPFWNRGNAGPDPAAGVSWNEAARFVNYLNTSTGSAPVYKFAVQPGQSGYSANADIQLWNSSDVGFDPTNSFRNLNASYFLPNENEWYKAAFYSGSGSTYFDYAGSDLVPTSVVSGTISGTAVYNLSFEIGPAPVTQAGGTSFYGARGMAGNLGEYTESAFDGINDFGSEQRAVRDAYYNTTGPTEFRSSFRQGLSANSENINTGFRVAAVVPEPKITSALVAAGLLCLIARVRRCRRSRKRFGAAD